jgi:hypothetical protein
LTFNRIHCVISQKTELFTMNTCTHEIRSETLTVKFEETTRKTKWMKWVVGNNTLALETEILAAGGEQSETRQASLAAVVAAVVRRVVAVQAIASSASGSLLVRIVRIILYENEMPAAPRLTWP